MKERNTRRALQMAITHLVIASLALGTILPRAEARVAPAPAPAPVRAGAGAQELSVLAGSAGACTSEGQVAALAGAPSRRQPCDQPELEPTLVEKLGDDITVLGGPLVTRQDLTVAGRGIPTQVEMHYRGWDGWDDVRLSTPVDSSSNLDTMLQTSAQHYGYGWHFSYDIFYGLRRNGVIEIVDAKGNRLIFTPSDSGQDGAGTTYRSSTPGAVLAHPTADSYELRTSDGWLYHFDTPRHQHVTRIEDPNGNALTFAYDANNLLTQITNASGRTVAVRWQNGRLLGFDDTTTTPARTVRYVYDDNGNLVRATDAARAVTTYHYAQQDVSQEWGSAGQPLPVYLLQKIVEPTGDEVAISYKYGRLSQVSTPLESASLSYRSSDDGSVSIEVVRQRPGGVSRQTYGYRDFGELSYIEDELGLREEYNWDPEGLQITHRNGGVSRVQFDATGNVVRRTDPLAHTWISAYDPDSGALLSSTDPLSHTTEYRYDALGNLASITDPLGNTGHTTWNSHGQMVSITDPLSHTTQLSYDAQGNLTALTDALGHTTAYSHDPLGRVTRVTDATGRAAQYTYDAMDRLTSVTDPAGHVTALAYDARGNTTRVQDPNGRVLQMGYDALDQLSYTIDPLGHVTRYAYDAWGRLASVTDPNGSVIALEYDERGNLRQMTDPSGRTVFTRTYDALGNVSTHSNARGQSTSVSYDAAGRMTGVDYPSGDDLAYGYDAADRLVSAAKGQHTAAMTYDAADRLTLIQHQVGSWSQSIDYTYDATGNRTSKLLAGRTLTYTYNAVNQLEAIQDGSSGLDLRVSYDPAGRSTGSAPAAGTPGVQAEIEYNAIGLVSRTRNQSPDGSTVFGDERYGYDATGTMITSTQGSTVTHYTYDAAYRLVGYTTGSGDAVTYTYDAAGNRTSLRTADGRATYEYDVDGQLLAISDTIKSPPVETRFTYDADGNMLTRTETQEATSETTTYTYDELNRLTRIDYPDGTYSAYTYNAFDQRLSKRDRSGNTVYYLWDGPNLVQELSPAGQVLATYVYGEGLDHPLSMTRGGQTYYYLYNYRGDVVGLSDGGGNLVASYTYDPWGNVTASSGSVANPFRFISREYDEESGLIYMRHRYYDPALGRFLTRDPAGLPDGPNRYIYALDNPVNFDDPLGLACGKPTGFGECHKACTKTMNPDIVQTLSQALGTFGAGIAMRQTGMKVTEALGNTILAGTTASDIQGRLANRQDPWWAPGVTGGLNVAGTALTSAKIGASMFGVSVSGATATIGLGSLFAGIVAVGGAIMAGWGIGTFMGCGLSCGISRSNWDADIKCPPQEKCRDCDKGPVDCDGPDGLPDDNPGGDHPDENLSAASAQAAPAAGSTLRAQPYVGLLSRGYAESTGAMINQAGEPYVPVRLDFSPSLASTLPVLVIPSGGLYGLETSASFRARLAAYVESGGTIISFDQQQGAHFGALPATAGGDRLGGYGWREDNSCFESALYLSDYHPVLSGYDKATLDVHVDGYFSTLPGEAVELLNRMKNGQPGLVLYPYPANPQGGTLGGWVLATTIYDDWGATNFQSSPDARTLLRDMLSWAYDPAETLPEYSPGDAISLSIPVTNPTSQDAAAVELTVLRPDRKAALSQSLAVTVPAGGAATPLLSWTLPDPAQLGIWWVEYTLRDAAGNALGPRAVGRRFVVSDPSPITGPGRDLLFSITAPTEHYVRGRQGEFTFHVFNQSDTARNVEVRYGLPHHTWETGDAAYGNFDNLHQPLTVAAHSEATYVYQPVLVTMDRLWASLMEGETLRDKAHFAVYPLPATVRIVPQVDRDYYTAGERVVVTTTLHNLLPASYGVESTLSVLTPDQALVYQTGFASTLAAQGTASHTDIFTLPIASTAGFYTVRVQTFDDEQTVVGRTRFEVPYHKLAITPVQPPDYVPDAGNIISFTIENEGQSDISSGAFSVTLTEPSGAQVWSDSQGFALPSGQTTVLALSIPFTNQFGTYQLSYEAVHEGQSTSGRLEIPFSNVVEPVFDRSHYRAGETMGVNLRVTNNGRFRESLDVVRLEVPAAAYSQVHAVGLLAPGQTLTDSHLVPLPAAISAGSHPVTVTLGLASGSQAQWTATFAIPPSELKASVPPTGTAGLAYNVTVANVGGVPTSAAYDLVVRGSADVGTASGTLAEVWPGEAEAIPVTLDPGAVSGMYALVGDLSDGQTGRSTRVHQSVEISGVSASLETSTERRIYLDTELITATASLTSTGLPLPGAGLSMQVLAPTGTPQWVTHAQGDQSLLRGYVNAIAIDGAGRKWFATDSGVSVLDDGGTPLDKSDDTWQPFTQIDGLSSNRVEAIAVDGAGYKWLVPYERGVNVLDDGGTTFDKSDDRWQSFTKANGLTSDVVRDIAIDAAGRKWFATGDGASVLDDGGTPLDKADDQWQSFNVADGLPTFQLLAIGIDGAGYKWFTTYYAGVSVLDDGGTPFNKADDQWQSFGTADGLADWFVRVITIDASGRKWFGTQSGVSVLDDGGTPLDKADDHWQSFSTADGLVHDNINAIAVDAAGHKWFGTNGGGVSVLDDGGTPLEKTDDIWLTLTAVDGLANNYVYAITMDAAGHKWFALYDAVNVLDDGGTPLDKADDTWQGFRSTDDGLQENTVRAIAVDGAGYKWFTTYYAGVSVLDDGGTPLDKANDQWQSFGTADGLASNSVYAIAVDAAGHKWFATQSGVSVLDDGGTPLEKADDQWQSFAGYYLLAILIDVADLKWFTAHGGGVSVLDDGGTPLDKTDDTWLTFTTADGLASNYVSAIAIDASGHKWFGTNGGGVSVLDDGGTPFDKADDTWATFTTVDGLANNYVYAITIDAAGRKWFGSSISSNYQMVSVLDDGGTLFDKSDDTWQRFGHADGAPLYAVSAIAIDEVGRKWFGTSQPSPGGGVAVLDDGGTPFDKSDDSWQTYTTADGLANNWILAITIDTAGRKWFATNGGGVNLLVAGTRVLWQWDWSVDLLGSSRLITPVGTLGEAGKLYLQAKLTSTTDQVVARDVYPFYVYRTQTGLTLETDRELYRPGQPMAISGEVRNESGAPLSNQTLTITQDGATIHSEGPFDVPAGGSHPFTASTSAPGQPGTTLLEATVGSLRVEDAVEVVRPQVEATVTGPEVVGSAPFSLTVTLTNTGQIEATVDVSIAEASSAQTYGEGVTVPTGESRLVQATFEVRQDAEFAVTLSGDATQLLSHAVHFGEAAELAFYPAPSYCPGWQEVPYVLTNTGSLDLDLTAGVTLTGESTQHQVLSIYLPVSGTLQGALAFDLAMGAQTLSWQHPLASGQTAFTVAGENRASLGGALGPALGGRVPLTVTVTNVGCNSFAGTLALASETSQGAFDAQQQPVSVDLAGSQAYAFALDTAGLLPGVYTTTASLLEPGGAVVDTALLTGTLPASDLVVTGVDIPGALQAGQTVTLTVDTENQGGVGDQASLTLSVGDLEDESQTSWLDAGQTGTFTYTLYLPKDLSSGNLLASYVLSGTLDPEADVGDWTLYVEGISVTVEAQTDQPSYVEGEPATLTLNVVNVGAMDTGELLASVAHNGITQTQSLSLTQGASVDLTFPLTATFSGDRKVFYGIYYAESDRSIVLNTHYLQPRWPMVTLLTDKQVYRPGETVMATLSTTLTQGTLAVHAPGYEAALPVADGAQFSFALPPTLTRGTCAVYYATSDSGTAEDGRERTLPFDVDGPELYVRAAVLERDRYAPGDTATMDLTLSSDRELDVTLRAWLSYPDGTDGAPVEQALHLAPVPNNHAAVSLPIEKPQAGLSLFRYQVLAPGGAGVQCAAGRFQVLEEVQYASGSQGFDQGDTGLIAVETDARAYDHDQAVSARLHLFAAEPLSANLTLGLGSGYQQGEPISLPAGLTTLTRVLPAGIPAPGPNLLTASLATSSGTSAATASFDYGVDLPDLTPGVPWLMPGGTATRTLSAVVRNVGNTPSASTTARFYDGDPDQGGTSIGSAVLPSLQAGEQADVSVWWVISGQGGDHTLYVTVDPVQEYDQGNNAAHVAISLPRMDTTLTVTPGSIAAGEAVGINLRLQNLQGSAALPVTSTVEIRSPLGIPVYSQVHQLTLGAGEVQWLDDVWQSAEDAELGTYSVLHTATDASGEQQIHASGFAIGTPAGPVRYWIYLPLVCKNSD